MLIITLYNYLYSYIKVELDSNDRQFFVWIIFNILLFLKNYNYFLVISFYNLALPLLNYDFVVDFSP